MKKYYEAYDERYKKVHKETGLAWAGNEPTKVLKLWLEKHLTNKNSKILEVGCGEGQNAIFLMENGFNVLASDVSEEAINWCKSAAASKNINENNFFVLDILENNHKEKYDCIYSISTVHMLVLDEDRNKFFKFIYNHLNDGGVAIVTSMGNGKFEKSDSNINKAFDLDDRKFNNQVLKVATTTCRIVNWEQFEKEALSANLKIKEKFVSTQISGFADCMVLVLIK